MVVTFCIDVDPNMTAKILDDRRLGKQRVEAAQIVDTLLNGGAWSNHVAVKSWIGYVDALKHYCNTMILEWIRRGHNNTMPIYDLPQNIIYPPWYSNSKVHYSHMARLLEKDANYYKDTLKPPIEYMAYGYIWPSKWTPDQLNTLSIKELGEPFTKIVHCIATKAAGDTCTNKAKHGNYCGVHKPKDYKVVLCTSAYKTGLPCKNSAKYGDKCGIHKLK
jgi:hypothetical protein